MADNARDGSRDAARAPPSPRQLVTLAGGETASEGAGTGGDAGAPIPRALHALHASADHEEPAARAPPAMAEQRVQRRSGHGGGGAGGDQAAALPAAGGAAANSVVRDVRPVVPARAEPFRTGREVRGWRFSAASQGAIGTADMVRAKRCVVRLSVEPKRGTCNLVRQHAWPSANVPPGGDWIVPPHSCAYALLAVCNPSIHPFQRAQQRRSRQFEELAQALQTGNIPLPEMTYPEHFLQVRGEVLPSMAVGRSYSLDGNRPCG